MDHPLLSVVNDPTVGVVERIGMIEFWNSSTLASDLRDRWQIVVVRPARRLVLA